MKPDFQPTDAIVFVIDDDVALREALSSLIRSTGLFVQSFASAQEFLQHRHTEIPSCIVLDVRLPGMNGLDLQRELADLGSQLPIIFITGHGDIPMSVRAMKAGAIEFLTKPFRDQDLLDAIEQGIERDQARLKQKREFAELHARYNLLTRREREVMELVVHGMLNKQIAAKLGTAEITVKIQRASGMKKMHTRSFAELVQIWQKLDRGTSFPEPNAP